MYELRKIKENWYMTKCPEKTNKSKIQFIVKMENEYLFMVSEWLTEKEISNINLQDWNFKPYKEVCKC